MRPLAELFRFSLFFALFLAIAIVVVGVYLANEWSSSERLLGWILIGTGVSYVILISPSAVLLVIMDDLREIRNHLIPNDKSEDEARKSSYKISQEQKDLFAGAYARANKTNSEESKNTKTPDTSERKTPRLK